VQGLGEWGVNILQGENKAEYGGLSRAEWAIDGFANARSVETLFSSNPDYCTWKDVGQHCGILAREIPGQNEQRFCSTEPGGEVEGDILNKGSPYFAVYVVRRSDR